MLAAAIIIATVLIIAAGYWLYDFFLELDELTRRSRDITDLTDEADELGKKGQSHE